MDYEDDKHVERMTSPRSVRPMQRENANPRTDSGRQGRKGVVVSCSNRRKADRRKPHDEDAPETGQRKGQRRQRGRGSPRDADQILVIALDNENLAASHFKIGDTVYVEPAFGLQTRNPSKPNPAASVADRPEKQTPPADQDYIVTLSGKAPKAK
ncbi:MAG: hypothetical protein ACE5G9_09555 [Nitrospinales bacterium]